MKKYLFKTFCIFGALLPSFAFSAELTIRERLLAISPSSPLDWASDEDEKMLFIYKFLEDHLDDDLNNAFNRIETKQCLYAHVFIDQAYRLLIPKNLEDMPNFHMKPKIRANIEAQKIIHQLFIDIQKQAKIIVEPKAWHQIHFYLITHEDRFTLLSQIESSSQLRQKISSESPDQLEQYKKEIGSLLADFNPKLNALTRLFLEAMLGHIDFNLQKIQEQKTPISLETPATTPHHSPKVAFKRTPPPLPALQEDEGGSDGRMEF